MNANSSRRAGRTRVLVGIAGTTALVATSLLATSAVATADSGKGPKITICHATASEKNPFTVNTVDTSSVANLVTKNGHGLHEDDIIPPFIDRRGDAFPGLNWEEGEGVWNGGSCDGEPGGGGGSEA